MIAFVCAMPMELRPLRRRLGLRKIGSGYVGRIGDSEVIAVTSGIGTALAPRSSRSWTRSTSNG
jgi:hypothetical protein